MVGGVLDQELHSISQFENSNALHYSRHFSLGFCFYIVWKGLFKCSSVGQKFLKENCSLLYFIFFKTFLRPYGNLSHMLKCQYFFLFALWGPTTKLPNNHVESYSFLWILPLAWLISSQLFLNYPLYHFLLCFYLLFFYISFLAFLSVSSYVTVWLGAWCGSPLCVLSLSLMNKETSLACWYSRTYVSGETELNAGKKKGRVRETPWIHHQRRDGALLVGHDLVVIHRLMEVS